MRPALLHLGCDGWQDLRDLTTRPAGLELHGITLSTASLQGRRRLDFTWRWLEGDWLGEDFRITLAN